MIEIFQPVEPGQSVATSKSMIDEQAKTSCGPTVAVPLRNHEAISAPQKTVYDGSPFLMIFAQHEFEGDDGLIAGDERSESAEHHVFRVLHIEFQDT